MFIDEALVRGPVGERVLTLSPSTFGSGSSVSERKHPPIFFSRLWLFALFSFRILSRPAFHNIVIKFSVLAANMPFRGSRTQNMFRTWEFVYLPRRSTSVDRSLVIIFRSKLFFLPLCLGVRDGFSRRTSFVLRRVIVAAARKFRDR